MSSADTAKIASTRSSTNSDAAPRERILSSALDLFYRHGIHAVGVDAIAEGFEARFGPPKSEVRMRGAAADAGVPIPSASTA